MFDHRLDSLIRQAAFDEVRSIADAYGVISAEQILKGFHFRGQRVPLINPQRGIYKPRQLEHLLSIRTVFPVPGRRVWYDDQRDAHRRIREADQDVLYDFMGQNPDAADNRWLREAMESEKPIIYFLGVAPRQYQAIIPTYIVDWDARALKIQLAFGLDDQRQPTQSRREKFGAGPSLFEAAVDYDIGIPSVRERRYALRSVKQRLHQASFRAAVIAAYQGRCAISGLPEPLLLDAAHIVEDKDERLGQPIITNGLPLSKVHHAAFDAHLIGIDPDYRIHVSERLLAQNDGPLLQTLKQVDGGRLILPRRDMDRPNRDRLELRFADFRSAI